MAGVPSILTAPTKQPAAISAERRDRIPPPESPSAIIPESPTYWAPRPLAQRNAAERRWSPQRPPPHPPLPQTGPQQQRPCSAAAAALAPARPQAARAPAQVRPVPRTECAGPAGRSESCSRPVGTEMCRGWRGWWTRWTWTPKTWPDENQPLCISLQVCIYVFAKYNPCL